MDNKNPNGNESAASTSTENAGPIQNTPEGIEGAEHQQESEPSTEIVLAENNELGDTASFDIKDIANESQRESIQQTYTAALANLGDSIDAFRRQIIANEGLFDETSENIFNRYALEIQESLQKGEQTDISFITRLAKNIYETINVLETDNRASLPTPDIFNGLIQAYGELDESLHATQLFLRDLNSQIEHPAIQHAFDDLNSLRSVIDEKSEALARIRYLSEEYHG